MSDRPTLIGMRKDGTEFPAEVNLSPIETEEGILVSAAIRDVTERQRLETEADVDDPNTVDSGLAAQTFTGTNVAGRAPRPHTRRAARRFRGSNWNRRERSSLVEGEPPRLVMKAHRGLSGELLDRCDEVPIGECLCGRAAKDREIVFCGSSIDDRSTSDSFQTCTTHGHYCVPILFEEPVAGSLEPLRSEGHKQTHEEEDFLTAVANLLAGVINRRMAQSQLRQSEERFDLAVSGSDAGIWDWDIKTGKVYFSPRWKGMLGYADHEIENDFSEWASRLHPDDRERAMQTVRRLPRRDFPRITNSNIASSTKTDRTSGSSPAGPPYATRTGQPHRMAGSHIDITSRKKSETTATRT